MNIVTKTAILIPACALVVGLSAACATPATPPAAEAPDRNSEPLLTVAAFQQPEYATPTPMTRITATPPPSEIRPTAAATDKSPAIITPPVRLRTDIPTATLPPTPAGTLLQAEPTSTPSPTATPQPTPAPTPTPENYGQQFSDTEIEAFIINDLGGRPEGKPIPAGTRCMNDRKFDATADGILDTPAYQFLTDLNVSPAVMDVFKEAIHEFEAAHGLRRAELLGPRRSSYLLNPPSTANCFQTEVVDPRYPVIRYTWEFYAKLPEGAIPDGHTYYGQTNFRFQAFFIVNRTPDGLYEARAYPSVFHSAGHVGADKQLVPGR